MKFKFTTIINPEKLGIEPATNKHLDEIISSCFNILPPSSIKKYNKKFILVLVEYEGEVSKFLINKRKVNRAIRKQNRQTREFNQIRKILLMTSMYGSTVRASDMWIR